MAKKIVMEIACWDFDGCGSVVSKEGQNAQAQKLISEGNSFLIDNGVFGNAVKFITHLFNSSVSSADVFANGSNRVASLFRDEYLSIVNKNGSSFQVYNDYIAGINKQRADSGKTALEVVRQMPYVPDSRSGNIQLIDESHPKGWSADPVEDQRRRDRVIPIITMYIEQFNHNANLFYTALMGQYSKIHTAEQIRHVEDLSSDQKEIALEFIREIGVRLDDTKYKP